MTNLADHGGPAPEFQMHHRLALALEVAHVRVGEMGDELGVARTTMSNYLSGRTAPSRAVLRVWALRCGVPFEWILTGRTPGDFGPDQGTHVSRCIRGPWPSEPTATPAEAEQAA